MAIPTPAAGLAVLLAAAPLAAQVRYTVVDLGVLPGDTTSRAEGINSYGDVVGTSSTGLQHRPFLFTDAGGLSPLPLPPGSTRGFPMAINDSGQIAVQTSFGACSGIAGNGHRWTPGVGYVDLGTFGGGSTDPLAMNAAGTVVGRAEVTACSPVPFVRSDAAGLVQVAMLASGVAEAINDAGVIAGTGPQGGFRFDPATGLTWLTPLLGYPVTRAQAIDGTGAIAGIAATFSGHVAHVFLDVPGLGAIDLGQVGRYSAVRGASAGGRIVGQSDDNQATPFGFVWDGQGLHDLNSLLVDPSWFVTDATAVNDRGQIAAVGWRGPGLPRALRLDPVPAAVAMAYGTGCGPSPGTLHAGLPRLGASVPIGLSGSAAGVPALLVIALGGVSPQPFGAGCTTYPDLGAVGAILFAATGAAGSAQWSLALPAAPHLGGLRLASQAAVFSPVLSLSNAVLLTLGQ